MGNLLSLSEENNRKQKGVLIVDDTRMMRMILASILKDAGIKVLGEAANGQKALELYLQLKPAVVTLDLLMPGMDGFTVLEKLLAYDPGARVVICSSLQYKIHITRALHAGAKDFIVKPFRTDAVKNVILHLLQDASSEEKLTQAN